MQSVVLDYHTIHHLTDTAVTRLASYWTARFRYLLLTVLSFNPLTPELNSSAQRCLTRSFYWGFCFLNRAFRQYMREIQQIHELFIQLINYVW
jgi:hypothetical protein